MESYWRQRVRQKQQQKSKGPHFNHVFPPHFCHLCAHAIFLPSFLSAFWVTIAPSMQTSFKLEEGKEDPHCIVAEDPSAPFFHLCVFPVPDG